MTTLLVTIAVLVLVGLYLSWTAGRLDRLHARVDAARFALDAQLLRRSATALELATSGLVDPAASVLLAGAAHDARAAEDAAREPAESDLTRALHAVLAEPTEVTQLRKDPGGAELLAELDSACRRVELARRFHNDAVRGAGAVRRQRAVRYLRLAGRAPMPPTFEMDDTPPDGLVAR